MKICKSVVTVFLGSLLCLLFVSEANANVWNEKTKVDFSQPVEVSGVVLPAGHYVFTLLNSPSDRHIVQIFNENQTRMVATVIALPAYRERAKSHTVITLKKEPGSQLEGLNQWFYPGDLTGQQFVG